MSSIAVWGIIIWIMMIFHIPFVRSIRRCYGVMMRRELRM